jgi:DNA repair protein RecO (recombination protein O)
VSPRAPLAAYVLHRWDWSETSLVVELFTRTQGRLVVVAKGAKRPTSQLRAVLLPFQPLWALLGKTPAAAEGEGSDIHPLRSAEWAGGVPLLGPAALLSGYYLNELLMKLLARQDPHPALYDVYADTLAALATLCDGPRDTPPPPDAEAGALRAFELRLLRETGLLPDLRCTTLDGQPLSPERDYGLHPEAGLAPQAGGVPGAAWPAVQQALDADDMAALRTLSRPLAAALRPGLRQVLHYHLGGQPLRTRQVGLELQRLAGTAARQP